MREVLTSVGVAAVSALVPFILVLVVSVLFKVLDKMKLSALRGIAEDVVLWAEEKARKSQKFEDAVAKLMAQAHIPREQAVILIQSAFEKLRAFIHDGRERKNG